MLHIMSVKSVACDCTPLCPGHLSVRVGDSSWPSDEIVNNLEFHLSMQSLFGLSVTLVLTSISVRQHVQLSSPKIHFEYC